MNTITLPPARHITATNTTPDQEVKRDILKAQLKPIDDAFFMASNDIAILMCNISRSEQNKLFTMYSHEGRVIDEWYEPLN